MTKQTELEKKFYDYLFSWFHDTTLTKEEIAQGALDLTKIAKSIANKRLANTYYQQELIK